MWTHGTGWICNSVTTYHSAISLYKSHHFHLFQLVFPWAHCRCGKHERALKLVSLKKNSPCLQSSLTCYNNASNSHLSIQTLFYMYFVKWCCLSSNRLFQSGKRIQIFMSKTATVLLLKGHVYQWHNMRIWIDTIVTAFCQGWNCA